MKHYIKDPMATTMLGDPAIALSYVTGQTSDKKYGGKPYSIVACLAPHLDGERVLVELPGVIPGLTEEMVQEATRRLSFVRVKFSGLVLEVKGGEYNAVTYVGTADHAVVIQPGQKSS